VENTADDINVSLLYLYDKKISVVNWWCCFITVDFGTASAQNGVSITQELGHIIVFF
jgi:hypothetical protein